METKLNLDRAIECLSFCIEHKLFINAKEQYKVFELPLPTNTGLFSEYRLMDDLETEDKEYWQEILIEDEQIRLSPGDIIIKK